MIAEKQVHKDMAMQNCVVSNDMVGQIIYIGIKEECLKWERMLCSKVLMNKG